MNENRESRGAKRAGVSIGGQFARNEQSEASGGGLFDSANPSTVADYAVGQERFHQSRFARQGAGDNRTGLRSSDWLEDELASGGADLDTWRFAMHSAWQADHAHYGMVVSRDCPELARFLDHGEVIDEPALRREAGALAHDYQQQGRGNRYLASLAGKFFSAPWSRVRSFEERTTAAAGTYGASLQGLPAEEVRTSGFTLEAIADGFDADLEYEDRQPSDTATVALVQRGHPFPQARITVADDGEVQDYQERWQDQWVSQPEEANDLRDRIRLERLAAAGIAVHGQANDGGHYGGRFVGGKRVATQFVDATQVSKDTRAEIKKATAYGALPADMKVSVRTDKYAGGQAVRINATLPAGRYRLSRPEGISDDEWRLEQMRTRGVTAEAKSISSALDIIGDQWNDRESEVMTDYYQASYHLTVQMDEA